MTKEKKIQSQQQQQKYLKIFFQEIQNVRKLQVLQGHTTI